MPWLYPFVALATLFMAALSPARAEQFVIVHVEPAVTDLSAGAVYESQAGSPEFVFVPAGVKVALLGEDGASYVIEGRAAVEASRDGLSGFRVVAGESDDEGLLARVFGIAGLSETTAAGRALPKETQAQAGGTEPGASLPLFLDFLPKLDAEDTFCLFSDSLFLRRLDARFLDRVRIEVKGRTLQDDLAPGEIALRFTGLGLKENERIEATLATKRDERSIGLLRLPAGVLDGNAFARTARLAGRGCTMQALMVAEGAGAE